MVKFCDLSCNLIDNPTYLLSRVLGTDAILSLHILVGPRQQFSSIFPQIPHSVPTLLIKFLELVISLVLHMNNTPHFMNFHSF